MIPRISRRAVPFLCLAGIALNGLIVGPAVLHSASQGTNDFRHFYLGGGLARSPHLYDLDYVLATQQRLLGESNPHLSAAVVGLVAWAIPAMPFDAAFAVTLLGSFLISRHTYLQDCAILLPSLLIWIRVAASPITQAAVLLLLVQLPYFLILTSHGAALAAALFGLLLFTVLAPDPDKVSRLLRLDLRRAATRSCSDSS